MKLVVMIYGSRGSLTIVVGIVIAKPMVCIHLSNLIFIFLLGVIRELV